jgi:endogenous inhibitor of DNA gyrase (YacG/DUF329 family)
MRLKPREMKCEFCRIRMRNAPVTHLHRHFCAERCKEDWIDMMNRINERYSLKHMGDTANA